VRRQPPKETPQVRNDVLQRRSTESGGTVLNESVNLD
jgi:hypothetical protein